MEKKIPGTLKKTLKKVGSKEIKKGREIQNGNSKTEKQKKQIKAKQKREHSQKTMKERHTKEKRK